MNSAKFSAFLLDVRGGKACSKTREWAKEKSWEEVYASCDRAEWLLWLFARTNPEDLRLLVLAGAMCANEVRHLMPQPSADVLDVAIAYGRGEETGEEELSAAYRASSAGNPAAAYASAAAAYASASASAAASVAITA